MKFVEQRISGIYLIQSEPFKDDRGVFRRSFCLNEFAQIPGGFEIKQTNISENFKKHTLRGFHFQTPPFGESKVMTPMQGAIYNVAVDLRPSSKTFKQSLCLELKSDDRVSLLIPKGCANAFLTLEDNTTILYYMSEFFSANNYCGFRYNDPEFKISWPASPKQISDKDLHHADFAKQSLSL